MKTLTFIIKSFLILGFFVFFFSCEKEETGQIPLTDTLESVSVITKLDSLKIYIVIDAVQVDAKLIIPAGTILKFTSAGRIDVNADGYVIAIGTPQKPIIFTSIKDDIHGGDTNGDGSSVPAVKNWGSITNWGDNSIFTYCEFYFGGGWGDHTATLDLATSYATVTHCTFAYNYGGLLDDNTNGALCAKEADLNSVINNNIFYSNDIPMTIDVGMSIDSTSIFHNPADVTIKNKYNGIFVDHYSNNVAVTWKENEVPFVMISHIGLETGSSLTLASNVVLKMYPDTRIDIKSGASLNHQGAIITSFFDDAHSGDTNGDGNATSPSAGDWVGINLGYGNYMTGTNILYALH
jgi:hypothetical protein